MALPLPTPTFYRLPDVSPTTSSIDGFLNAVYTALTSSVDYRGTTIPSTHLWTWARYQSGSTTEAIYNTAVPSGTLMTQNPCIMIAGVANTASYAPTMLSPDVVSGNVPIIGLIKNPGAYLAWNNANPMTSGQFSGFAHLVNSGSNNINAVTRIFVSQESYFFQFIMSNLDQYWVHVGAIVEPFSTYQESLGNHVLACETDDRVYGFNTIGSGGALSPRFYDLAPTILINAATNGGTRFVCFEPKTSTMMSDLSRRTYPNVSFASYEERDATGKYVFETFPIRRTSRYRLGQTRAYYTVGVVPTNTTTINGSNNTNLYHLISGYLIGQPIGGSIANFAIALKAAP